MSVDNQQSTFILLLQSSALFLTQVAVVSDLLDETSGQRWRFPSAAKDAGECFPAGAARGESWHGAVPFGSSNTRGFPHCDPTVCRNGPEPPRPCGRRGRGVFHVCDENSARLLLFWGQSKRKATVSPTAAVLAVNHRLQESARGWLTVSMTFIPRIQKHWRVALALFSRWFECWAAARDPFFSNNVSSCQCGTVGSLIVTPSRSS